MARPDHAHSSRRRWPAVISVAALIAISLAAGASAQLDVETVDTRGDTVVTPVAKDGQAWVRYAGAEFGTDAVPAGSITDVGTQFYGVAFENEAHGFAGGMRCKTAPPAALRGADLAAWLETCGEGEADEPGSKREPVIYEYVKTETTEEWFPVLPPTGTGYVASIAFMPGGRALAVGGTGRYPKREPSTTTAENDPTGEARAWLYANGFWTELDEPDMAPGMRGLTAVAMAQVPNSCNAELSNCGLAGGYRQLWMWKDGKFRTGWGTTGEGAAEQPLSGTIDDLESFRFRVRQIAFNPNQPYFTKAFAVTSGCCDAVPSRNVASGLVFDGEKLYAKEFGAPANNNTADPVPGDDPAVRRDTPDSLYSLVIPGGGVRKVSVVATPGGPPPPAGGDRASRVYGNIQLPNNAAVIFEPSRTDTAEFTGQAVSTMRLNGAAGWRLGIDVPGQNPHRLDWAVGSLATGEGVAYFAEDDRGPAAAGLNLKVLTCGSGPWPDLETNPPPDLQCQPYDAPGYLDQTASKTVFRLPTYGLNAIAFTDSDESVAWAVGDRGALVRFGGVSSATTADGDEAAPKLGSGSTARFGGSDVYDAFRPLPVVDEPAPVPSLAANGTREVERPELVSGGAPNPAVPARYASEDVTSVVMSRDGSEGWAIGSGGSRFTAGARSGTALPTVYHYDGLRWSRCDIWGVPGLMPADPACAGLAKLRDARVSLRFATRVPLEHDKYPSNDDEFEVVALPAPPATGLIRYRRGEWFVDQEGSDKLAATGLTAYTSIAFTSPDDGWITTRNRGDFGVDIVHWNGTAWVNCRATPAECGAAANVLPVENAKEGRFTAVGRRIYLSATRYQGSSQGGITPQYPMILYKDPGGQWTAEDGGHDPLCPDCTPDPAQQGQIFSVAVSADHKRGWAVGYIGTDTAQNAAHGVTPDATPGAVRGERRYLLRLSGKEWRPYPFDDASADYLSRGSRHPRAYTPVFLDQQTGAAALYALDSGNTSNGPGFLLFDPSRGSPDPASGETGRWRVLQTPFHTRAGSDAPSGALPRAFVPDERGGAWLFGKQITTFGGEQEAVHVWHYTRDVPNEVFEEAPHPIRERITGGAAAPNGSFWVTTNSSFIYRYDRLTGWDRLRVPGWDPGRVVTRASSANAVAVGPDGEGLVVGETGRLAQISPLGVQLDPAAGTLCGDPPCGTGRTLRAVDIAPDGSAMAGGDSGALLWRPAGEAFRAVSLGVANPPAITGVAMPSSDRVWLTTNAGHVYAGTRSGYDWKFTVENRNAAGKLLSLDDKDAVQRLTAIDIDADGEGYAVGERGLILQRDAGGGWERLKTGFMDTFRSVALSPQGRDGGALVGGDMGLILTLEDGDFRVSREADLYDPLNFGTGPRTSASVRAVAMVPGLKGGEVEAWAVQQVTEQAEGRVGPGTVLHYSSDGDDPLMRPGRRVDPLPDTPDPRKGEISFAAFGRSECNGPRLKCPEGHAGNLFHEVLARRVTNEVIARSRESGGPGFAVFTGDVGRAGGLEEGSGGFAPNSSLDGSWVHKRWKELVAERFAESGVPLFGAVGLNDLDRTAFCTSAGTCPVNSKEHAAGAGLAFGWRKAMADLNWGTAPHQSDSGLVFTPVEDRKAAGVETSQPVEDEARTHYALDVTRGSKKIARLIFLDNSMRALNTSDPGQNPVEPDGQLAWLDRMLATVDREGGQQAIAVMNTPTYSYQAGDPTTWATDAAEIERRLLANDAKMLVSGRLGWNGRFWATAPGVHHPCPEGDYIHDDDAPDPSKRPCADETAAADDVATRVRDRVADAMQDLGAPAPPGEEDVEELTAVTDEASGLVQGLLPQVVASSAGGPFGPNGNEGGPAGSGWWHGYTLVRMAESGKPNETIVEQRPIFDWISITGSTHVLKPRQRMTLFGEGREPVGADVPARYDRINSNAITHRYDLVMADEKNPGVPRRDENGEYVPVPTSVGEIDSETGVVRAGAGRQERTYTVAILSVGDKAASWPIAFEPAKSFKPRPVPEAKTSVIRTPPRPLPARPLPPLPVVLNSPPAPTPPPTPPANIPQVNLPTLNLPSPPALPNIPALPAGTPTPTPPPPAAPPAPPGNAGALPLTLEAPITPISIVPTVIPPAPPPVNPAPPSGSAARKEARQRQAATAKSEEGGGDQGAGEGQSAGEGGSSSEMTRRDRARPAPSYDSYRRDDTRYSFTAVSQTEQASAWSRGALYGGMSIATALVLALGWGIARPTPKRRHPPRPAPGTVRERPRQ